MSHKSFVWLCLLPLAAVTTAFFLLPMARLVLVGAEGPQGLAGYLAILTEPRYRATLFNTVLLAAATTIVTLIVATIAGMFLQRHRFPGRAVLIAMLTFWKPDGGASGIMWPRTSKFVRATASKLS